MEIQCTQENFLKGIISPARIATTRSSLPILANICLRTEEGRLKISATDLEIGITYWIGAKIEKEGSITLPAKLLSDFVANNNDSTLFIRTSQSEANIISEKYNATIKGMDSTDFPLIPEPKQDFSFVINKKDLKIGFQKVVFAAAIGDNRPVLNGIALSIQKDQLIIAATDSYRLAEKIIEIRNNKKSEVSVIVPTKLALELIRILSDDDEDIICAIGQNQISFQTDYLQIISRLVEGVFPNYRQIIPKEEQTIIVTTRAELLHSIKIVDFFAKDSAHSIKLKVDSKKKQISFQAISSSFGENQALTKAEIKGKDLEISFNAKYLLDCLNANSTEQIELGLFGIDRPMIIKPINDSSYFNLVMPLKTGNQ